VFVTYKNNAFTKKWPSLIAKTEKSSFYEEKSLVGLTPGLTMPGPTVKDI
jgi:hypothetical protein